MKLINKNKYSIEAETVESKLSGYDYNNLSVLDESNLQTEIIENIETVIIPKSEYIKSLRKIDQNGNFDVVQIVEMSAEEKSAVDAETQQKDYINSFHGYSFIIEVRRKFLKSNGKYKGFALDMISEFPKEVTFQKEVDGKILEFKKVWFNRLSEVDGFSLNTDTNEVTCALEDIEVKQNPLHVFEIKEIDEENRIILKMDEA